MASGGSSEHRHSSGLWCQHEPWPQQEHGRQQHGHQWQHRPRTLIWPLEVTQATEINTTSGGSMDLGHHHSLKQENRPQTSQAISSSRQTGHLHRFRWQHRPQTIPWSSMVEGPQALTCSSSTAGSWSLAWPPAKEHRHQHGFGQQHRL